MFKKQLFITSVILLSHFAEAKVYLWPAILKARLERTEEQSLDTKSNSWPTLGISYRWDSWLFTAEQSLYKSDSDNGNVSIETTYEDKVLTAGYSLFQGDIWDLYVTGGLGTYQQKVKTSINNISQTNRSDQKMLGSLGAEFLVDAQNYWALSAGARFNWTEDLDPELMPEFYLKFGVGF